MAKYRARRCPNCNFYVGFSIAKPPFKLREFSVTSFCLNCNYELPMHMIVRGLRRVASPLGRKLLRVVTMGQADEKPRARHSPPQLDGTNPTIHPSDYGLHLRAIGQSIENLDPKTFNLERVGNSYMVWTRPKTDRGEEKPDPLFSKDRLQSLWKNRTGSPPQEKGLPQPLPGSLHTECHQYTLPDIERLDRDGRRRRSEKNGAADGHGLSQLLRTIGSLMGDRNQSLLGISWRELSIGIVVQTAQGKREIDIFRPENLYDLWVGMYLRRADRTVSDVPR